jgi:hypothetical protein
MEDHSQLIRPVTLEINQEYLFFETRANGHHPNLLPVKLYAYDTCPAFVIVMNRTGNRWRCLREELFIQKIR